MPASASPRAKFRHAQRLCGIRTRPGSILDLGRWFVGTTQAPSLARNPRGLETSLSSGVSIRLSQAVSLCAQTRAENRALPLAATAAPGAINLPLAVAPRAILSAHHQDDFRARTLAPWTGDHALAATPRTLGHVVGPPLGCLTCGGLCEELVARSCLHEVCGSSSAVGPNGVRPLGEQRGHPALRQHPPPRPAPNTVSVRRTQERCCWVALMNVAGA
jgi:hypothetical protein